MSKLDTAIRWLYDSCAFDSKQTFEEGESYRAAIRVLEAAANDPLDFGAVIKAVLEARGEAPPTAPYAYSALPEEEK